MDMSQGNPSGQVNPVQESPIPTSFNIPLSNENSIMKTSFLPNSQAFNDPPVKEERERIPPGTNSKLSNLFNRMISPSSNSIIFSSALEGFQKDNSLCFPYTFEGQSFLVCLRNTFQISH